MTGLVRADTELMLVAAEEMQRVSQLMLEQFDGVHQAMLDLQNTWWEGRHRQVIEGEWWTFAVHWGPAAATLQNLAVRLKRTATALDAAALRFDDPVASPFTSSAPSYLRWMLDMLRPSELGQLGLSSTHPVAMLDMLLSTPTVSALWQMLRDVDGPDRAALNTQLPANGPPPRIFIINGINSDAVAGAPDNDALLTERKLEELGYHPQDVEATAAVYNTNLKTQLQGTNFGGWLSPLDAITGAGARSINTATNIGNTVLGVEQVAAEYILGENGFYTQQTIDSINQQLAANPLLEGQEVVLIAHSGGGAIAPSVAKALQRSNITTAGIVTMGVPVSNRDQASRYARQVVELRDQHDYIGLPIRRSAEGRVTNLMLLSGALPFAAALAAEAHDRDVRPNVTAVTTRSGEQDIVSAHTSYWNSEEVLKIIRTNFPAIDHELQRRQEQPANP